MSKEYYLDLAEGFSNDAVIVRLNDQEIYSKSGLSSDLLVGRAARISIQPPFEATNITITATLPRKDLTRTEQLSLTDKNGYLGGFYLDSSNQLRFRPAESGSLPFYG